MKVWVYLNGIQQGPYSMEQVALLPLEPSTPVWYEGLPKWVPAAEAPLTAPLFANGSGNGSAACATEVEQESPARQTVWEENINAEYAPGDRFSPKVMPKKPSTHMVWCIILTVLCCSPFGIAGLFTGSFSTQRYNRGDYSGAERMSEVTEWMIILGIVFALVGLPMVIAFGA